MKKFVCSVCGYVHEGDQAPEKCPQCKVPAEKKGEMGWAAEHIVGVAPRTAHSLNPVPFIVYDKDEKHELKEGTHFGLANVAPTVAELLGLKPYECWEESMLK